VLLGIVTASVIKRDGWKRAEACRFPQISLEAKTAVGNLNGLRSDG
jgi:hypothetical protein